MDSTKSENGYDESEDEEMLELEAMDTDSDDDFDPKAGRLYRRKKSRLKSGRNEGSGDDLDNTEDGAEKAKPQPRQKCLICNEYVAKSEGDHVIETVTDGPTE